ncbi:Pfs, NACHT and ankyrin domain protein [Aureobasidium pullulans]|nr:Pfs, NACHT and ankyrin domain protein [Aureobasidium pullulans]
MNNFPSLESKDLYTVGWIAALPHEMTAALAMLEERHGKPLDFEKSSSDKNSYCWGRIGHHNVVMTPFPSGVYGTTPAARTATQMSFSFPNIRLGLMVGIGAAIARPLEGRDIRLGDIVVSQPHGRSGGVIQYDRGKNVATERINEGDHHASILRRFELTGSLNQPPEAALTAINFLQAEADLTGSKVPQILKEMLKRYPRMAGGDDSKPGYVYQGQPKDRLFEALYVHASGLECDGCDPSHEVLRHGRERPDEPQVHYGVIASGNRVIKDAFERDSIVSDTDEQCLCIEMEAAGLMNSFPCLVIRGICDYADSHKNDRWQKYAAATAAAYAKEFLWSVDNADLAETSRASEILGQISVDTKYVKDSINEQKIMQWLAAPNYSANHNRAMAKCQEGTGLWFLHGDLFKQWQGQSGSFLWLHGIPGCGKTTLSSTIVEHLKQDTKSVVVFFYFDFSDTTSQSVGHMLRSLIKQLCFEMRYMRETLDQMYTEHADGSLEPSERSLEDTLTIMLGKVDNVSIVLDALDESNSTPRLLDFLKRLVKSERTTCRLLVTSRQDTSVGQNWVQSENKIMIQADELDADIAAYIHYRVRDNNGMRRWCDRPEVQESIEEKLVEKANGMFRWVACQLDALENCCDKDSLYQVLGHLPETLNETYRRIILKIPEESRNHARTIMRILLYSGTPMNLQEMVDAIAVSVSDDGIFNPRKRMPEPLDILSLLSSLVVLTPVSHDGTNSRGGNSELRLAHSSVKEYLLTNPSWYPWRERREKTLLAKMCLDYLSSIDDCTRFQDIRSEYPLSQYAASNWARLAQDAEPGNQSFWKLMIGFLRVENYAYSIACCLHDPERSWTDGTTNPQDRTIEPLYYASLYGLGRTVEDLIRRGADVNARSGRYDYALHAASHKGHGNVVKILLANDANVEASNEHFNNALEEALYANHNNVAKMLIEEGVKRNNCGQYHDKALRLASLDGQTWIVQMLLENHADPDARDSHGNSALQIASYKGHDDIVRLLIDRRASINTQGGDYGSALIAASYRGHEKVVRRLLDGGAKADVYSEKYGSALHASVSAGHRVISQILLSTGAKDSLLDRFGWRPSELAFASRYEWTQAVFNPPHSLGLMVQPRVHAPPGELRLANPFSGQTINGAGLIVDASKSVFRWERPTR